MSLRQMALALALASSLLAACAPPAPVSTRPTGPTGPRPVAVPNPGEGETVPLRWPVAEADVTDLQYGPEPEHLGDLYLPTAGGNRGVIVVVHGGAFVEGDRSHALAWYGPVMSQTSRGFAILNITYRLTTGSANLFPAAVHDVSRAVDWVRADGAEHGLNAERVIVAGHSSGGTLATLVGVGSNAPGTSMLGRTARVDGWLSMSGLYQFAGTEAQIVAMGMAWVGLSGADRARLEDASPVHHLDRDDPPGYLVHGDVDPIVPASQARTMIDAAAAAGISTGLHHDIVDTGSSCRDHLPQCGMNAAALGRWLDGVVDGSL